MNITNGASFHNNKNNVSFSGHKQILDDYGVVQHKFFYPFDNDKYNASLEIYRVSKDGKGNYHVLDKDTVASYKLNKKGEPPLVNIENLLGNDSEAFAYRYKLVDKSDQSKVTYAFEAGNVTDILDEEGNYNKNSEKFNYIINGRAILNKPGVMQLTMLDQYNPGYERGADGKITYNESLRAKALTSVRTHINKLGGNFVGFIKMLDKLKDEGYTRIVGMPITKDTVSSHLYWTQNAFQLAPQLGTMADYKEMQQEMYKRGINWVADAALVNEGLQGIHFANVLKWGKDSPFYNWFKINGLDNGVLSMGVLPKKADNVRFKLVNSPYDMNDNFSKNDFYDPTKPTYVQFYDERLASDNQKRDNNLILTYEENNTKNSYDITSHDDVVYPYSFEINPNTLKDNVVKLKKQDKNANLQDIDSIRAIMQFENFKIDQKNEGGFVAWDGNVDIAKLNFAYGAAEDKKLQNLSPEDKKIAKREIEESIYSVQDYAVNSGKYWTKLSKDVATEYTANLLKTALLKNANPTAEDYKRAIDKAVDEGKLPDSAKNEMTPEVVENILSGDYVSRTVNSKESTKNYIMRKAMDFPLEALPVNPDLTAVLTSPFITRRAVRKDEVGLSRFDLYKKGVDSAPEKYRSINSSANSFYENEIQGLASEVINNLGLDLTDGENVSDLGAFVIDQIMPDIVQFGMLKSLDKDLRINFTKDGDIDFSSINPEDLTLANLKVVTTSPEAEAKYLLREMKANFSTISKEEKAELIEALKTKLKGANEQSYKMAEAIVDRTESGLGWRIDAAKDVASIDSVRSKEDTTEEAFQKVIDFWKAYNKGIQSINPHVYTAAEITDMPDLLSLSPQGRFSSFIDAETKFLQETGITTVANYNYFYSLFPEMYSRNAETGAVKGEYGKVGSLRDKVVNGWQGNPGFMFQTPLEGVLHSYTFLGNHDKPRLLHVLALDMDLFYSDFSNNDHKNYARDVLVTSKNDKLKVDDIDFDKVDASAIAMGKRMKDAFNAVLPHENVDAFNETFGTSLTAEEYSKLKTYLTDSISDIVRGEFKNSKVKPDAFGARPFDVVLSNIFEQAKFKGLKVDKNIERKIKDASLENILTPAFDKYYTMYKSLVTLPGDVTDFGGDKVATSGYESKAKNYYQQNRNVINWEWLDKNSKEFKPFVKDFNTKMNEILALRKESTLDGKLSALNDGVPVSLPFVELSDDDQKAGKDYYGLLRYNDNGSTVITLYNTLGTEPKKPDNYSPMDRKIQPYDIVEVPLTGGNDKEGLAGGLKVGTIFKSTNPADNGREFAVEIKPDGQYVLKAKDGGKITIRPDDYNALVLYKA